MSTIEKEQAITRTGLSAAQVEASRREHGVNVLTPPERDPWWKLFLEKFEDPVIRILMIAAVIAIGVGVMHGTYVEGIGIIVAILLATSLAFLNEYKAGKEFDILNQSSDDVPIKVRRDNAYTTVPRKDVVVGDLVLVEVGEEMPADGRILEAVSFQVNEARLTGEAKPVTKVSTDQGDSAAGGETAYPPDRAFRGTVAIDGYGLLEITAVGDHTEIGKTAQASAEDTDEQTPLNMQLEKLSKLIGVVGLGVAALTFAALVFRGALRGELIGMTGGQWYFAGVLAVGVAVALIRVWLPIVYDALGFLGLESEPPGWLENESVAGWVKTLVIGTAVFALGIGLGYLTGNLPAEPSDWLPAVAGQEFLMYFMVAVTIIVVAVPEGLAMSVTLSLAYSMRKMTASNNLVRKMHACETIGAATVICSDKTGTLTLNEMRLHDANFAGMSGKELPAEGPGNIRDLIVEAICANTTAHLSRQPGEEVKSLGNPTEGALLLWLEDNGVDYVRPRARFTIGSQWTFTTERKFMGTIGQSLALGVKVLHAKGAPEIILARCTRKHTPQGLITLEGAERDAITQALKEYQGRGMRTLAFAYHEAPTLNSDMDIEHLAQGMVWLGFAAIADPVRVEVPAAIQACRRAGVGVKIVTGDNPETGQEIARQIGLWDSHDGPDKHISGAEFARMDEATARKAAQDLKVLSRARPTDKMRLVTMLQQEGHVVAVTGDGVNDGPALNYANVGLAMGKTGTAVAKEASDIILLDDSFRSIVNAIMWGRSLYENIQRFILFQLTINVAALLLAFLGPFIGIKLPLTVMQMLWINLIMDTFAALALATEPAYEDVMKRPPRDAQAFIISGAMARNILVTGTLFLAVLIGLVVYLQNQGPDVLPEESVPSRGGTILFTVFVMLQFWNLFNARCLGRNQSAFKGLGANPAFLIIAIAIFGGQVLLVNFGGAAFRTVPLTLQEWGIIIASTSLVLWGGEAIRLFSPPGKDAGAATVPN